MHLFCSIGTSMDYKFLWSVHLTSAAHSYHLARLIACLVMENGIAQ